VKLAERAAVLRPAVLNERRDAQKRQINALGARLRSELLDLSRSRANDLLAQLSERLKRVSNQQVEGWSRRLDALERVRLTVGYEATLRRGYAVVRSGDAVLTTKAEASEAARLEIEFQDGRLELGARASKKAVKKSGAPDQGSLF